MSDAYEFKKITSKDKSFISREPNGQVWAGPNDREYVSCGSIINGACNIHKPCSLDKKYDEYFAVNLKLLRFAERFDVKKLRLIKAKNTLGKYGWIQRLIYGYVPVNRFEYLMKHRKNKKVGDSIYVLLKEKDAEWKEQ